MDYLSVLTTSATTAEQVVPITTAHLILIVLLAIATIFVVWCAARIRARKAREREEAEEASERINEANDIVPEPAPPPPSSDTPVPAAAPLDAAPATLAADMEPVRDTPDPAPAASDDLTRLKGIGPKLAAQLAELGHPSYASLAALSPAEADALDAQLGTFKGRLARDRVVEQAGYLAKGDTAGFEAVFGKL